MHTDTSARTTILSPSSRTSTRICTTSDARIKSPNGPMAVTSPPLRFATAPSPYLIIITLNPTTIQRRV